MKGLLNKNAALYFYQTVGGWWAISVNGEVKFFMFYWQAAELWAEKRKEFWSK